MNFRIPRLGLLLFAIALLSACGSPGVPLPPSLELPRRVTDLRASRKADKVTLTWSAPRMTTDQQNIRHGGATAICRDLTAMKQCVQVGQEAFHLSDRKNPGTIETYTDQIPANLQLNPLGTLFYAVSVQNSYRRSAGLSNQVQVPSAPTLAPPSDFAAQLTAGGVRLTWEATAEQPEIPGLRFIVRAFRRDVAAKRDSVVGEVPLSDQSSPELVDTGFEWEKTYEYRLTVVTIVGRQPGSEELVEGNDTQPVTVVAHDVFPPAPPAGLQAVFSGSGQKPFIDLVWSPNNEGDFAGYNVYRREEGTPPSRINSELIKSPAFRDTNVVPGHTYTYSVSAVDVRGNESAKSAEAGEAVPAQ